MRKRFTIITIVAFLASSLFAQNHTTVYGNLGVENVNISVVNTQYGTSTDKKGHYELPIYDRTKIVKLYYSCIGYADTIISLTPRQLVSDSIDISFKMRKLDYDIQEITITAKQQLKSDWYFFMDFEVFDSTLCVLAACPNGNFSLILSDGNLNGLDTIPIPKDIKPEKLMRDCLGNCQLIGKDSVYQIDLMTKPYKLMGVEKIFFLKAMDGCLFATDKHIYFKEKVMQGYITRFFRIELETKTPQLLFTSNTTDNLNEYYRELAFHSKNPPPGGEGRPIGVYARFLREFWDRPSDTELLLADNNLYLFDQNLGFIKHYDLDINIIDSCAIEYPFAEGWKYLLYQDIVKNKFYTVIKNQLYEVDPISGKTTPKTKLNLNLCPKAVINNGTLYFLYPTGIGHKTALYRERIE